jgi:hypothetical protein
MIGRQTVFLSKLHQSYLEYQIFEPPFIKINTEKMLISLHSGDPGKIERQIGSLTVDNPGFSLLLRTS